LGKKFRKKQQERSEKGPKKSAEPELSQKTRPGIVLKKQDRV